MKQDNYCVIMAGGVGSRFWPLSRSRKPKQFLDILGTGKTLIQETFQRFTNICPPENIIIVTNKEHKYLVKEQLPQILDENIIGEPLRRNTAPCIDYANFKILDKNPRANIIVAPSDHLITMESEFIDTLKTALEFSRENNSLVTLGIKPNRPETGYGYIQIDKTINKTINLHKVKTFTEKPDYELAKVFYESGEFLWNSGIFIWTLESIMGSFTNHLPEIHTLFLSLQGKYNTNEEEKLISEIYSSCKSISIDYGIMEKAKNVNVISADFGWSDLGTWSSLHEHSEKDNHNNVNNSPKAMLYDTTNSIINVSNNKQVIVQGLDNKIVVETDDVLMICDGNSEQKIKQIVTDIKLQNGSFT